MAKRLSRIAPGQAGKLFAVIYFVLSWIFVIPMAIAIHYAPLPPNGKPPMSPVFLAFLPFHFGWIASAARRSTGTLDHHERRFDSWANFTAAGLVISLAKRHSISFYLGLHR